MSTGVHQHDRPMHKNKFLLHYHSATGIAMTTPCTKEDVIDRIANTVESIHTVVTDIAVQNGRITTLETTSTDHETRIRKIEKTPLRLLYWVGGILATVIAGFFTHRFWG